MLYNSTICYKILYTFFRNIKHWNVWLNSGFLVTNCLQEKNKITYA